jgi:hypothetical protein
VPARQSRCLTCRLNARSIMMSLSHWRGGNFEVESVTFFGGPGCAFILNGMVFRIPLRVKSFMAPFLVESRSGMEPSSLACLLSPAGSTSWPDFRHPSPPSSAEATL